MADEAVADLVPPEFVPALWPYAEPLLAPALARVGEYAPADVLAELAAGRWRLFVATAPGRMVGAGIAEIVDRPRSRTLVLTYGGGVGAAVALLWPVVREAAGRAGCGAVRIHGRPGWRRSGLLPAGAKHVADVIEWRI